MHSSSAITIIIAKRKTGARIEWSVHLLSNADSVIELVLP